MNGSWRCSGSERRPPFHRRIERRHEPSRTNRCRYLVLEVGNQEIAVQDVIASAPVLMPNKKTLMSTESEQQDEY